MVRLNKIPQRLACIRDDFQDFRHKRMSPVHKGLPIIIVGTPRSGTTMLGELLNSHSVMYYHEPFKTNTILWNNNLAEQEKTHPANLQEIKQIWTSICAQQAWQFYRKHDSKYPNLTKGALHKKLQLKTRRIIVKDPSLCYWLQDLLKITGPVQILMIFRDPRGIVASLKSLNWDPLDRLNIIFNHPYFTNLLPENAKSFAAHVNTMSALERMALQTALLHNLLYRQAQETQNVIAIQFEALIQNTHEQIQVLQNRLQLDENHLSVQHVDNIMRNENTVYARHSFKRESMEFIDKWRTILSTPEAEMVMRIYNQLNPNNAYI